MRVRQSHFAILFVGLSYFVVACGNSSDAAAPSNAGSGNGNNSNGGNSPGNGGAGNGTSGGSLGGNGPGTHLTGLVKLNLKVR